MRASRIFMYLKKLKMNINEVLIPLISIIREFVIFSSHLPWIISPLVNTNNLLFLPVMCQSGVEDIEHFDGLAQDCRIFNALAMEILQFYIKPSITLCFVLQGFVWEIVSLSRFKCPHYIWQWPVTLKIWLTNLIFNVRRRQSITAVLM